MLLLSCTKSNVIVLDPPLTVSDRYDFRFVHVGDIVDFSWDDFSEDLKVTKVVVTSQNEEVASMNYKEQLVFLRTGATSIRARVTYEDGSQNVFYYGYFYAIDLEEENVHYVNNFDEFQNAVVTDPYGVIVINDDFEIDQYDFLELGEYFYGALLNPEAHVISQKEGTVLTHPLMHTLTGAYVDGLILEGLVMESVSGALASQIFNSKLVNVRVSAQIQGSENYHDYVGGIVGYSRNIWLSHVVFEGSITAFSPAGLIGIISYPFDLESYSFFQNHFIENCAVIADLVADSENQSSNVSAFTPNDYEIPLLMESSYFAGTVTLQEEDSWIVAKSYTTPEGIGYEARNLYVTIPSDPLCIGNDCILDYANTSIFKVSQDDLLSGNALEGLEEFEYEIGKYPTPSYVKEPWQSE